MHYKCKFFLFKNLDIEVIDAIVYIKFIFNAIENNLWFWSKKSNYDLKFLGLRQLVL